MEILGLNKSLRTKVALYMSIMLRTPDVRRLSLESIHPQAHLSTPLPKFTRSPQAQERALLVGQGRKAALRTPARAARRALKTAAIAAPEAPTQEKCAPPAAMPAPALLQQHLKGSSDSFRLCRQSEGVVMADIGLIGLAVMGQVRVWGVFAIFLLLDGVP